jgi:hypothetical protein
MANFLDQKFFSIKLLYWLVVLVVVVAAYGYTAGWYEADEQTILPDDTLKLKLEPYFNQMIMQGYINGDGSMPRTVANSYANYNNESRVVAVQIDAEKTSNATHTVFVIKTHDVNGNVVEVANVTQLGVLSTPTSPVIANVSVGTELGYVSGFTNKNEIMTSSVSASAPVMRTADGKEFYPVVRDGNKPLVKVGGSVGAKNLTWTFDGNEQAVNVNFVLDWEGINQMTSISDEITIPIKYTNTDGKDITVRIIKNAAL